MVVLCRMGRVKLKIKRLENTNGRQATYAKRKHGIMKKANELSILCDIDIVLLMFSPSGKPSICRGMRRYLCSYFHFLHITESVDGLASGWVFLVAYLND